MMVCSSGSASARDRSPHDVTAALIDEEEEAEAEAEEEEEEEEEELASKMPLLRFFLHFEIEACSPDWQVETSMVGSRVCSQQGASTE